MSEARLIARHAGTVLAGQLAVMAFAVTDTLVAGRYAEGALAALSVGSAIFISVFVSLLGVLQALLPMWAELHGGQRTLEVGRSVRQSLYLGALATLLGVAVLLNPGPLLRFTDVPPALQGEVERYLAVLALALPPALLFRIYSTLNQSLGKPHLVTLLQLGSVFVKIPLSIWFTFGGLGLEPQGVVGCAWATVVDHCIVLAVAVGLLRTQPLYRPYQLWRRMEPPDWPALGRFARLGVPAGLSVMVEVTSFTLMALFIARLGTTASAAHQIAANVTVVLYMVPLSLAIATSARVSFWLGASEPARARRSCRIGFTLTLTCALLMAGATGWLRSSLGALYSANPAVTAMAGTLLLVTAAYHLADAVQTLCVFVLRSYRVTLGPLLIYGLLLWGGGLGGGYALAYRGLGPWPAMQSAAAFWLSSAVALTITAMVFSVLLWNTVRRSR